MIADSLASSPSVAARPPGGWLLPLRVLLFGLSVPFLVRRGPERMARLLEPAMPPRAAADPRAAEVLARRIDRWLRAGWPLVRRGCLTRGITQYRFLRRTGFDVSLRFGVGEVNGRFEGHCWLVQDGRPFLEKRDPRPIYTEMWRIG
ncbi:MAG TPA: lasso peptide biosynthesis B2 protein [Thermoanaerobaculia bacterium]|nr:lasso peptide biosynthesis B2 protein [Thermoanaerobaculia bacterium]